jgi:hypothetical protein
VNKTILGTFHVEKSDTSIKSDTDTPTPATDPFADRSDLSAPNSTSIESSVAEEPVLCFSAEPAHEGAGRGITPKGLGIALVVIGSLLLVSGIAALAIFLMRETRQPGIWGEFGDVHDPVKVMQKRNGVATGFVGALTGILCLVPGIVLLVVANRTAPDGRPVFYFPWQLGRPWGHIVGIVSVSLAGFAYVGMFLTCANLGAFFWLFTLPGTFGALGTGIWSWVQCRKEQKALPLAITAFAVALVATVLLLIFFLFMVAAIANLGRGF